jgi:hypothetical protein
LRGAAGSGKKRVHTGEQHDTGDTDLDIKINLFQVICMDIAEGSIYALIALSKDFQKKLLFAGSGILMVGILLGILIAFVFISQPLIEKYNTQLNKMTNNQTMKCFDTGNMSTPVVIDFPNIQSYCANIYVLDGLKKNMSDQVGTNFPFMKKDELNFS